jgi:hypothetical protein
MEWSEELIDEMFRLLHAGKSASQVAVILGTTKNSIIGKSRRERIKRGLAPIPRPKRAAPPTDRHRSKPKMLTLPHRADGLSKYVSPPTPKPHEGQLATIVDVTGCRWEVSGSTNPAEYRFCNHAQAGSSAYCEYHRHVNTAPYSRKLINKTLAAIGLRFKPRAA